MLHRILLVTTILACSSGAARAALDDSGWTIIVPGIRQVFVSSSAGSDTGNGSSARPFKTIGRAVRAVGPGTDLLLKRGDVFYDTFGSHTWSNLTVGAYGTGDRPLVLCETTRDSALVLFNSHDLRIVDLHLAALHRDPSKSDFRLVAGQHGIYCKSCNYVLVENCLIEYFGNDITLIGGASGFALRRCVIRNAYSDGRAFSQGIYLESQQNALIEDCVFDACGWNPILQAEWKRRQTTATTSPASAPATAPVVPSWIAALQPRAGQPFPGTPNIFNHAVYNNDTGGAGPITIRNCVFVNSASTGVQARAGGVIDNCLFIHNGMATDAFTEGPNGQIVHCVCLGSNECPDWAGGGGLTMMSDSGTLSANIVAHGAESEQGAALILTMPNGIAVRPNQKASIDHNIVFDWPADDLWIPQTRARVRVADNVLCRTPKRVFIMTDASPASYVFDSNMYEESPGGFWWKGKPAKFDAFLAASVSTSDKCVPPGSVQFPDPGRTIESYAKAIGLPPTLHDFMAAADQQSRDHWDVRLTAGAVNDYVRAGFGMGK